MWADALRRDDPGDHKYARGHLTILGGAAATGAARLAAIAARRAGAGLVDHRVAIGGGGDLSHGRARQSGRRRRRGPRSRRLLEDRRRNGFLIGPGSGVNERTRDAVLAVLAARRAVVLDADAVTVFADDPVAAVLGDSRAGFAHAA